MKKLLAVGVAAMGTFGLLTMRGAKPAVAAAQTASIAPANPPQVRETRFAVKWTYAFAP